MGLEKIVKAKVITRIITKTINLASALIYLSFFSCGPEKILRELNFEVEVKTYTSDVDGEPYFISVPQALVNGTVKDYKADVVVTDSCVTDEDGKCELYFEWQGIKPDFYSPTDSLVYIRLETEKENFKKGIYEKAIWAGQSLWPTPIILTEPEFYTTLSGIIKLNTGILPEKIEAKIKNENYKEPIINSNIILDTQLIQQMSAFSACVYINYKISSIPGNWEKVTLTFYPTFTQPSAPYEFGPVYFTSTTSKTKDICCEEKRDAPWCEYECCP